MAELQGLWKARGAELKQSEETAPNRPLLSPRSPLLWVLVAQGAAIVALAVWIFILSERMAALELDACLFGGLC